MWQLQTIFDAALIALYAIRIVACSYKVQYEVTNIIIKRDVVGCVY